MNVLAVFVGGLAGTALRLGADALLPHAADGFPWSTLLVNVAGSFVLGLLVGRVWPTAPEWLRYGLGTGLLGSFTTFSALAGSVYLLYPVTAQPLLAVVYLAGSLLLGFLAAWLGLRLRIRRATPPIGPDE